MYQDAHFQIGQVILAGQKISAVDVGGAGGLLPHWNVLQGNAKFYMYEPRRDACDHLRELYSNSRFRDDFNFINTALAGSEGFRKLYITNSPTSSSLLRPNTKDDRHANNGALVPYREELIRTKTLAASLDEEGIGGIDAIKLDTQGAELEILKGLDEARLSNLLVIEAEAGLTNAYEGVPTLGEILEFMEQNGFELFDMRTQRAPRSLPGSQDSYNVKVFGVLDTDPSIASKIYEVDLLCFKKLSQVLGRGAAEVRKLIFCQCAYNFCGEAMHTVMEADKCSTFKTEERNQLLELIKMWQQVNSQVLAGYNNILKATQYQVWGQYTWIPYPNM